MNRVEIEAFLENSDLDDEFPCGTASEEEEEGEVSELESVYDSSISTSTDAGGSSEIQGDESTIFPSKNGTYFWSSSATSSGSGRFSRENVMNTAPGPSRYAIARTDGVKSAFALYMPHEILKIIVEMTNIKEEKTKKIYDLLPTVKHFTRKLLILNNQISNKNFQFLPKTQVMLIEHPDTNMDEFSKIINPYPVFMGQNCPNEF